MHSEIFLMYRATNDLGTRLFRREEDAYDWAIKVIQQTGIKTVITHDSVVSEKHIELLAYLKKREPFKTTLREIIRDTSINSLGSASWAIDQLIKSGYIQRISRSTYIVFEKETTNERANR